MLDSLKIQNFRMLEDFEVKKLGRINLIVGKNNSGKSSVLEALRIYAGNADFDLLKKITREHNENLKFEFNKLNKSYFYPFQDFFTKNDHNRKTILIGEINDENKYLNVEVEFNERDIPRKLKVTEDNIKIDYFSFHDQKSLNPLNDTYIKDYIPCEFIPTQFLPEDKLSYYWDKVALTDDEKIVYKTLKIIEPHIQGLTFINKENENNENIQRIVIVKLGNQKNPVPLKSLGEGVQRVLQIILKMIAAKNGILLIDEFESGLHYSVQEKLWEVFFEIAEKLNVQVFATTHSWDCIESFTKVALEKKDIEGVLIHLGRDICEGSKDFGKVISTVYEEDSLNQLIHLNMEIR